jgi:glycosyltransferase involved in cell wall biosynthesis
VTATRLDVVIPVHCEEEALPGVVAAVGAELAALDVQYRVIVVDDGSNDGTWQAIEALCKAEPQVAGVRLSRRFGKESAVSAGLELVDADAVLVMDGDGQHPPSLIPELVRAWRAGAADVVEAVKRERGDESWLHRVSARAFYALTSRLSGYDLREATDFKLLDRRVLDEWRALPERNLFFRGMVAWLGFRRERIPFSVSPRAGGKSRFTPWALLNLGLTAVTAFSTVPLRLVTLVGGLFLLFSFALALQTLWVWGSGRAVSGFTTVILLLLVLGSALLLGLGVIGEYLARIYQEVKGRPRYVSAERVGALPSPRAEGEGE